MKKRIISLILCMVMCMSLVVPFSSCGNGEKDTFTIMIEEMDGVFNPFYSTTGADGTIVSMTQIGMLTSKYVNGKVDVAYGDNEAVATKDFEISEPDPVTGETTYTFVLKNGIKYSNGTPLTMKDVLFNLYVYLDPVYTGSSTMYSTKIKGLSAYRTQKQESGTSSSDEYITSESNTRAQARIDMLIQIFNEHGKSQTTSAYYLSYEDMVALIADESKTSLSSGYISAISGGGTREKLKKDYDNALAKFKEELNTDYTYSETAYEDPSSVYAQRDEFDDDIFCFMYTWGEVTLEYYKDPVTNKEDKNQIINVKKGYPTSITTKEAAINYIYDKYITSNLEFVLSYTATAQELKTEYAAEAKEVILHESMEDGQLAVDHIEGIVSLGHHTNETQITVNGTTYNIAQEHNADGTPVNANEYDVLQITIEGQDPKAHWNFSFAVAPQYYYGDASVPVDIENHKYGVEYATYSFQTEIIQAPSKTKVPVGAGAYKATDSSNKDNPSGNEFSKDKIVYFKANNYFETVGSGLNNAKIEKVRYQVVPANDAINALANGSIDYISPQLTTANYAKLMGKGGLSEKGYVTIIEDQLGYGYIGINASKVEDINLRKAIMCAMNTALALDYYDAGTANQIFWPMSTVSWAYPKVETVDSNGNPITKLDENNGADYPSINWNEDDARVLIEQYMEGYSAGDSELKITFTIAGSNLTDHPTYAVFRDAAALLNDMGWEVTVVPDTQALTKLATGSLEVWAAAWGSTLDPDMYQVYHKNSSATSTLAWGYPSLKTSGTAEEKATLNELSEIIDLARETTVQSEREAYYKEAMELILDLAIELPVYQRSVVYTYNSNVIDSSTIPSETNPYSTPLDRIWEIDFAK